jgi:4-amino-4-deoxy-L-arabinose transferase-like glycosyltransferase
LFFMLVAAVEWRAMPAVRANLIEEDGAYWASLAAALARGDWAHGLSTAWPPGYPALIAVLAWIARAASHPAMLEGCARFVSVIAGTLVLIPLYGLARRVLPQAPARAVILLAAFHPRLTSFSAMALSEMTFTLFLIAGLASLAAAEDEGIGGGTRARREGLAGVALGASYLVRPEGLLLAIGTWLVGLVRGRSRSGMGRLRPAFLAGLLVVSLPYLMFLHARLGTWSLGEKGAYNFWRANRTEYAQVYPPPSNLAHRVNESPEISGGLPPDRVHMIGFALERPGALMVGSLRRLARIVLDTLPTTLYWPIAALALLGFAGARSGPWWVVVTPLALSPLLYAPFSTDRRFFVPLVPLLLIGCGQGLRWLDERWPAAAASKLGRVARPVAMVLLLYSIAWSLWLLREQHPAKEQRAMGEWLRHAWADSGSARPIVAARKPWVAFYSGGRIAELPDTIPGRLGDLSPVHGPVFVVADARSARSDRPRLLPLLDPAGAPGTLILVHRIESPALILLYRVAGDSVSR